MTRYDPAPPTRQESNRKLWDLVPGPRIRRTAVHALSPHITGKIKCCISPATRAALTDITLIFYVGHLSGPNRVEAVVDRSMCDDAELA
jgi:hypothetical protein